MLAPKMIKLIPITTQLIPKITTPNPSIIIDELMVGSKSIRLSFL
jgi:hypothetical protein